MSDSVRIVEVGPRDGLQNEKTPVGVADRIAFIEALLVRAAYRRGRGLRVAEGVPQMVNSDQVLRGVSHHPDGEFHVLVPNEKGYEAARPGARVIAVFASASEGFSRANINCSVAESIERFKPVIARAKADGVRVRGYIPACWAALRRRGEAAGGGGGCRPFVELGCYEISLGDTIGVGTPMKAKRLLRAVAGSVRSPISRCISMTLRPGAGNLYAAWRRAPA